MATCGTQGGQRRTRVENTLAATRSQVSLSMLVEGRQSLRRACSLFIVELLERVKNHSFAGVRCVPALDDRGFDIALVVAKLTYSVDAMGNVMWCHPTFRFDEVYDEHGGVRYPSDFAESKPGLDIGLVGKAYPRQRDATQTLVWMQVGGVFKKVCQVFGARAYVAKGNSLGTTQATKLEPVMMSHGLAWGGTDRTELDHPHEARNPVGRGFAKHPHSLVGTAAHTIEPALGLSTSELGGAVAGSIHPDSLQPGSTHASHAPLAPLSSWWEPRRSRQGTYDHDWRTKRAPVRPLDFDPMHNSWAAPDQHLARPCASDEPIEIGGATPEGIWRFKLPKYEVCFALATEERARLSEATPLPSHLDSLLVDADERFVELTYRTSVRLPRKWERLPRIMVHGVGDLPDSIFSQTTDRGPTMSGAGATS